MATDNQSFTQSHVVIISGKVFKDNAYKNNTHRGAQYRPFPDKNVIELCGTVSFLKRLAPQLVNKFPLIFRSPKIHCRLHNSPSLVPTTNQIKPVHSIPTDLRSILILSSNLSLHLPSDIFPLRYTHRNLVCTTLPAHLILLSFDYPPNLKHF